MDEAHGLTEMALFPLATVLLPGASLSLRIFEPRYLAMVKACSRYARPFGVCLILDGAEAGPPAAPAAIGTLAEIRDFRLGDDGLLQIKVSGRQRFRVEQTRVRDDGLILVRAHTWPDPPSRPVPPAFGLLQQIAYQLLQVMDDPEAEHAREDLEQADGLSFRLAQWLPLSLEERQQLLEQEDALSRLETLQYLLPRFQKA